ncbi:WcaG Nucleoside-diphosphate-sugar epimerases [Candidatus Nanopelagicaceae bacterium]
MKILLTGAAGFLGSHLTSKLLDSGHEVIGLDDLSTGSLANLTDALSNPSFSFIEHDVRIPFDAQVDAILNFACPASPKNYQLDPVRTIETNFLGIINMLHLAKKNGSRILQASTSEVYGDPSISPQPESYWGNVNPIGIRSCYDEGKRAAETLCFDYKRQYGVDARVIRIFNTYGPNMAVGDGRVVSNFIVQALQGRPITIYGDGSQTRSFCYVSDLVEGIYKVLLADGPIDTPINLGNPGEFSMIELAKKVIAETGSDSEVVFEPLPQDDPRQRKPDIGLAKKILNWEPLVDLDSGIKTTAEYFAKELKF